MRYVALASADYGAGRVLAYAGRLGWRNADGGAISPQFARRIVEWLSGMQATDVIEVCHVPIMGVDGVVPTIDRLDMVSVTREDIDFLSVDSNLSRFDCIIVSGYSSSSPLVRANLLSYVSAGGGLVVEDFREAGAIDILQSISPFSVDDIGFPDIKGVPLWTEDGKLHDMFSESFLSEPISMLNTIFVDDVGSGWEVISVFDTDGEVEEGVETELVMVSSDGTELSGEYFMAYYRSVYEDGMIELKKSSSSSSGSSSSSLSSSSSSLSSSSDSSSSNSSSSLSSSSSSLSSESSSSSSTTSPEILYAAIYEGENASRHIVTANGNAQLDGNGKLVLPGSSSYISVPASTDWSMLSSDWTYETYLNSNILTGAFMTMDLGNITNHTFLRIEDGGKIHFSYRYNNTSYASYKTTSSHIAINTDYHIRVVVNSGTFKIFIDGISVPLTETTALNLPLPYFVSSLYMGHGWDGVGDDNFEGELWQTHFYKSSSPDNFTPPLRTDPITVDEYTVLALDFAGAEGWKDSSPSQHNITPVGDAQLDGTGKCVFDGTGDYLTIQDSPDWTFNGDCSISFKLKTTSTETDCVFQLGTESGSEATDAAIRFIINDSAANKIDVRISDTGSSAALTGTTTINDGAEHLVELIRIGTTWTLKIDTVSEDSVVFASTPAPTTGGIFIGTAYNGSYGFPFSGSIGELEIVNNTTSVLALDFDGPAGQTKTRILDSAKPAYASGRHEVTANGDAQLDGNGSCVFDGTGDYLTVVDNGDFDIAGSFVFEGYVKFNAGGWVHVIGSNSNSSQAGVTMPTYFLSMSETYIQFYYVTAFSTYPIGMYTPAVYLADTWYHVAICRDISNNLYLSVDGTIVSTASYSGTITNSFATLGIGGIVNSVSHMSNGSLSRVKVSIGTDRDYTSAFTPPLRTDPIVPDEYTVLALDFVGTAASTTILDSAPQAPAATPILPDISGNENDVTQTTTTKQMLFDPSDNKLIADGGDGMALGAKLITSGSFTSYSVVRPASLHFGYIWSQGFLATGTYLGINFMASGVLRLVHNSADYSSALTYTPGTKYIITVVYDHTVPSTKVYVDGALWISAAVSEAYSGDDFSICSATNAGGDMVGEFEYTSFRSVADSDGDRATIEQLLTDKYFPATSSSSSSSSSSLSSSSSSTDGV